MKKIVLIYLIGILVNKATAQNNLNTIDSTRPAGKVTIIKDSRLDELAKIDRKSVV